MFRSLSGYKSEYHYLKLLVVSDFDEWKVLVEGPEVTIQGARQFTPAKAQDHAVSIAKAYIHEEKHEDLPPIEAVDWSPTDTDNWLKWQA